MFRNYETCLADQNPSTAQPSPLDMAALMMTAMLNDSPFPRRLAVDCVFLRRTLDTNTPEDPFLMLCTHIIRDGRDCIGPFLENIETDCQLWEPNERLAARLAAADEASSPTAGTPS